MFHWEMSDKKFLQNFEMVELYYAEIENQVNFPRVGGFWFMLRLCILKVENSHDELFWLLNIVAPTVGALKLECQTIAAVYIPPKGSSSGAQGKIQCDGLDVKVKAKYLSQSATVQFFMFC